MRPTVLSLMLVTAFTASASAAERIVLRQGGREISISAKLLVTAEDGGLMALTPDGKIWPVKPDELVSHKQDDTPFVPLDHAKLTEQLQTELPQGFRFHSTKHYLICYNTTDAYAEWCGGLFERLYGAFTNYWSQREFELREPEFPMVAVVFADRTSFTDYAKTELGDAVNSVIGYYSFRSNQMTMYDLTGIAALRGPGDKGKSSDINQVLSQPKAERTVATIIHEATHQIAFNCGLQTRYADNPLWVSEGLAVYFETPDLKSRKGWRNIGAVNQFQFGRFQQFLPRRPIGSLATLLTDDRRMRDPQQSPDAYAEAWALNYFLMTARPKQYHEYLQMLSKKPISVWDTPEQRLADFRKLFGDLEGFDADFQRFMRRVR